MPLAIEAELERIVLNFFGERPALRAPGAHQCVLLPDFLYRHAIACHRGMEEAILSVPENKPSLCLLSNERIQLLPESIKHNVVPKVTELGASLFEIDRRRSAP